MTRLASWPQIATARTRERLGVRSGRSSAKAFQPVVSRGLSTGVHDGGESSASVSADDSFANRRDAEKGIIGGRFGNGEVAGNSDRGMEGMECDNIETTRTTTAAATTTTATTSDVAAAIATATASVATTTSATANIGRDAKPGIMAPVPRLGRRSSGLLESSRQIPDAPPESVTESLDISPSGTFPDFSRLAAGKIIAAATVRISAGNKPPVPRLSRRGSGLSESSRQISTAPPSSTLSDFTGFAAVTLRNSTADPIEERAMSPIAATPFNATHISISSGSRNSTISTISMRNSDAISSRSNRRDSNRNSNGTHIDHGLRSVPSVPLFSARWWTKGMNRFAIPSLRASTNVSNRDVTPQAGDGSLSSGGNGASFKNEGVTAEASQRRGSSIAEHGQTDVPIFSCLASISPQNKGQGVESLLLPQPFLLPPQLLQPALPVQVYMVLHNKVPGMGIPGKSRGFLEIFGYIYLLPGSLSKNSCEE